MSLKLMNDDQAILDDGLAETTSERWHGDRSSCGGFPSPTPHDA